MYCELMSNCTIRVCCWNECVWRNNTDVWFYIMQDRVQRTIMNLRYPGSVFQPEHSWYLWKNVKFFARQLYENVNRRFSRVIYIAAKSLLIFNEIIWKVNVVYGLNTHTSDSVRSIRLLFSSVRFSEDLFSSSPSPSSLKTLTSSVLPRSSPPLPEETCGIVTLQSHFTLHLFITWSFTQDKHPLYMAGSRVYISRV